MYDFENNELNYLGAGIHQNVKLVKISKEPSKKDGTGQTVLRFTFEKDVNIGENIDKYYYIFTAFPLDRDSIIERNQNNPNSKYDDTTAVKNEFTWFSNKLKHILGTFIPKEKLVFKIAEKDPDKAWNMLCDKIIELAGTSYEGHSFELKLILDIKNRAGFPRYSFKPFIRNMTNTVVKIAIDPNYERIVPTEATENSKDVEWASDVKHTDENPFG